MMLFNDDKSIGSLNPIFLQGDTESEFIRWFLPARIRMARVGFALLTFALVILAAASWIDSNINWIVLSAFGLCGLICGASYLVARSFTSATKFDLLLTFSICLMAAVFLFAHLYTSSNLILYAVTLGVFIVWVGALSGLSFLFVAIATCFITITFSIAVSFFDTPQYFLMSGGIVLALINVFFSYFKELQLRESFIRNQFNLTEEHTTGRQRPGALTKPSGTINWSKTLKDLSVTLLSVDRTEDMFNRLLDLVGKVIKCEARAACLHKDGVLTRIALQGSLTSSNLPAKDLWPIELIRDLKSSKNVKLSLASFGLLESSVKDQKLTNDYRLDIPVFSKNNLSAVVTLLRKESEFVESEIQLASSMVFHAMIALRLAKFQKNTHRNSKPERVIQEHWLNSIDANFVLYERKEFIELAKNDFKNIRQTSRQLSLLLVEIDHYNDIETRYGEAVAQGVYLAVIEMFDSHSRQANLIGCYDRGSFAMQVSIGLDAAERMAESLRAKLANRVFRFEDSKVTITVSIGVTTLTEGSSDYMSMLRCADMGLFLAKDQNGNMVRVSI